MKVLDLDNNFVEWRIGGYLLSTNRVCRSSYHLKCRELLKERYPTLQIAEEVPILPHKGLTLYLDFYVIQKRLAIEVMGQQHYSFSSLFHSSKADFIKQQKNDMAKEEWCELNRIKLVKFKFDEGIDVWKSKLV